MSTLLSSAYSQLRQQASRVWMSRGQLPVLLILLGLVAIAVVAGDILGGSVRLGKHIGLMLGGLAAFSAGVGLDLTVGKRYAAGWLEEIAIDKQKAAKFLVISVELCLIVLVIREFRIGNQLFYERIAVLTLAGFLIHYFLPHRYRLPFFLLLSLVAMVSAFGLSSGTWLIGIGLALIGICHLPIRFSARVMLLLLTGGLLALLRMDRIHSACPPVVWPILGSMFMFTCMICNMTKAL